MGIIHFPGAVCTQVTYRLCKLPVLLQLCKLLLASVAEEECWLVWRWTMRCLWLQQALLSTPSSSLWTLLHPLIKSLDTADSTDKLTRQVSQGGGVVLFGRGCGSCSLHVNVEYAGRSRVGSIWSWRTFVSAICSTKWPG